MMREIPIIAVLLAIFAVPVAADQTAATVPVGAAVLVGEAPRILLPDSASAVPGDAATLILVNPATGDLQIRRATLGAGPDTGGEVPEGRVAFGLRDAAGVGVGFALIGPLPRIDITGGVLRVDVTGDDVPETLTSCLTTEAVQLRAPGDEGIEVWSEYVPLGYDVEPTCP